MTKQSFHGIILSGYRVFSRYERKLHHTVAVAFSVPRKRESFCLPRTEGGDSVDFITWNDLLQIALLVFAILSVFYNKKR